MAIFDNSHPPKTKTTMSTQIRTFLFTGLLFLGLATGVQAQDKYEFASALHVNADLIISIEGKPVEKQRMKMEPKDYGDHSKLFEYVSNMQDEGWEVYNVLADGGSMRFVLRRKKA